MDCFFVKYPSEAVDHYVIVRSTEGYAMRIPANAYVKVASANGSTASYVAVSAIAPGAPLVLNRQRAINAQLIQFRAKAWLIGALIPIITSTGPDVIVSTPRTDLMTEIISQASKTKCATNCMVTACLSESGIYHLKSAVFDSLAKQYSIMNGVSFASRALLVGIQRTCHGALLAGLYTSAGQRVGDSTFALPAISDAFAIFIMSLLIKHGIRSKRNDNAITINGREDTRAFCAIINKYHTRHMEEKMIMFATDSPIVPGYGSRAPSPLPVEAPAATVAVAPAAVASGTSAPAPTVKLAPEAATAPARAPVSLFSGPEFIATVENFAPFASGYSQLPQFMTASFGAAPREQTPQYATTPFEKIEQVPKAPTK